MALPELFANPPTPGGTSVWIMTTLGAAVTTAPAAGTQETWTFAAAPPAALAQAGQFRFIVDNEILLDITGGGGTSRTVLRGQEGTTPATHLNGANVYHVLTAASLANLRAVRINYGDGSDGAATCDGVAAVAGMTLSGSIYTLTRDCYFTNLTVNTGVTVITAGYRLFGTGTLTNNGTIHNNGSAGSGATGGAGGLAGVFNGGLGGITTGAVAVSNGIGGSSNAGGGRTPGVYSLPTGGIPRSLVNMLLGGVSLPGGWTQYLGGQGGSGSTSVIAGGGGGGILVISFRIVINNGVIQARGAAGAAATGTQANTNGGGGGYVGVITGSLTGTGTMDTNGGPAGTGGTGAAGSAGSNGNVVQNLAV